MMSHYDVERLLARIASGTTTERDARQLRNLLRDLGATAPVARDLPTR
jgi:DNA mismatch repair ATPase MutS